MSWVSRGPVMDIITGSAPPSHEPIHNNPRRVESSHGLHRVATPLPPPALCLDKENECPHATVVMPTYAEIVPLPNPRIKW